LKYSTGWRRWDNDGNYCACFIDEEHVTYIQHRTGKGRREEEEEEKNQWAAT
jgi:sRNA-binding protein